MFSVEMSFYLRFVAVQLLVQTALSALIPWEEWDHQLVALEDSSILFHYAGSGPPLLLVHGFPEHSVHFKLLPGLQFERLTFHST